MNIRKFFLTLALFAWPVIFLAVPAMASGGSAPVSEQEWHFNGMLGKYDKAAMRRGFKVYREVCSACHSMKRVRYRNLADMGYNENQIKNIASEYTVMDGPDDEGEMFERPALPSDAFVSPYANNKAAVFANNGALPPDLSLIIKARSHGPDYVYALLTGYEDPPEHAHIMDGQHWNKYMPGHVIAMAPPLFDGVVSYDDGSAETTDQYAKDVVNFLAWGSDPYMEVRKHSGIKVLIFLAVFAAFAYGCKRKLWSDLH